MDNIIEIWGKIFSGDYEVSNLGNVRRATPGISTFIGRPVRSNYSESGYAQVSFLVDGKQKRFYVHHLVMLAFVGERPPGHVINHIDLNKKNNHLSNLQYITQQENCAHSFVNQGRKRGPCKPRPPLKGKQIGANHWMKRMPEKICRGEQLNSKVTAKQVLNLRLKRFNGKSIKDLGFEFGLSIAQVSRICNYTRWRHIS